MSATNDEELNALRSTLFLAAKGLYLQSSSCYIGQMLYHIFVNWTRPQERQLIVLLGRMILILTCWKKVYVLCRLAIFLLSETLPNFRSKNFPGWYSSAGLSMID
jgi:hypothetical protein